MCSHLNRGRLEELVAEHLDHLYYIKDILGLGLDSLSSVLTDQLLNRLLIPLYVFSLTDQSPFPEGVSGELLCCSKWCVLYQTVAREPAYQHHCGPVPTCPSIPHTSSWYGSVYSGLTPAGVSDSLWTWCGSPPGLCDTNRGHLSFPPISANSDKPSNGYWARVFMYCCELFLNVSARTTLCLNLGLQWCA